MSLAAVHSSSTFLREAGWEEKLKNYKKTQPRRRISTEKRQRILETLEEVREEALQRLQRTQNALVIEENRFNEAIVTRLGLYF